MLTPAVSMSSSGFESDNMRSLRASCVRVIQLQNAITSKAITAALTAATIIPIRASPVTLPLVLAPLDSSGAEVG